ncbi:MAG: Fic family protein [Candidatus Paceibacteria bacterium]|jgi:Fic family protein
MHVCQMDTSLQRVQDMLFYGHVYITCLFDVNQINSQNIMSFNREIPYNDLPLLPPKVEVESKNILKKAITANKALAGMASLCKQLPNESVLYNSLFLKEAKDSSAIENIITTNDDIYQSFTADQKITNQNTREVMFYLDALWVGMDEMKNTGVLTERTFVHIVNTIRENTEGIRRNPGTRIANQSTGEIVYSPPEGRDVISAKLKNIEEYINTDDGVDFLIKMSIMHYQFEAIHPFADGNGRTGRILNVLYLVNNGLVDHPMLFLSKYIIDNKDDYYTKLRLVTENGEWESWIIYMLEGIEETSNFTSRKINDIVRAMKDMKNIIRKEEPKMYSKDLLEVLFKQPYCKTKFLEEAGIAKRETAAKYLNRLEELDILKSKKVGKEKLYVNKVFYEILKY